VAEPPVADEAAAEREEGFVDLVAAVVADEQPFEVVQPGERALDNPACASESRSVLGLTTSDLGGDAASAEFAPVLVVVVAAVGRDSDRSPARPTDSAAHRRDSLEQWEQLRDVVAVAARDRPGKRDPGGVY
jgi:hypothetical protein